MVELTARMIFLAVFLSAIAIYVWWDKNLKRHSVLFIRRTQKGIKTIDSIASKAPRFWNYYGWAGVFTGIISIFAGAVMIGYTFFDMFKTQSAESGPSFIFPGLVSETTIQPGVSFVPVEYWVISIIVLMTVHEMSHGIVARTEDIDIKSVGWIILGVLPLGAFVEPEGEKMLPNEGEDESSNMATWDVGDWKSRMKVLCAGSFANYLTAALFFLLVTGFTAVLTQPSFLYDAQEGYPAAESGMENGTIISINGEKIDSLNKLRTVTSQIEVNETVDIRSSEGNFSFKAAPHENRTGGYIGIRLGKTNEAKEDYREYSDSINWFLSLLFTVSFLNFLIGIFNMVPIKPLDGGLVFETVTIEFFGEEKISNINKLSLAVWALLISGIIFGIVSTYVL